MKTGNILSEFSPISTEQWEQAIRESVTGPDYASKLIWHPEDGLAVKPYYRAEDLVGLQCLEAAPGEVPYIRGNRASWDWRIREQIDEADPDEANRAACEAVAAGGEEIGFSSARVESISDVSLLLKNLNETPVHFEGLDETSLRVVANRLDERPRRAEVSANFEPLHDLNLSHELIRSAPPGFRPFVIHADEFQEHGTGAIEEVGFAVSAATDFVSEMLERGLSLERVTGLVAFEFAMGPEFFIQIAKLRAFRMVWTKIVESFGGDATIAKAAVHTRTAHWNKTIYDPHVNILRATTEAISAILGGADSLSVAGFDACYRIPDENSRRIARNTQLILKREAQLARVADPIGGSYLIESVTNTIATKAWRIFQELEAAGGYRKARSVGVIDSVIEHCSESRNKSVASRRLTLTGTNRFANTRESALDRVDEARTEYEARVAGGFEKLRLRTERAERNGKSLRVLLAEIGDARMRSARSQFAGDFIGCAGLLVDIQRFESPEQIAGSDADVIVLCSSDPEYPAIVEELEQRMKKRGNGAVILIAGNPESAEQLRELGIFDFVHLKSNAVDVLGRLQQQIGIED